MHDTQDVSASLWIGGIALALSLLSLAFSLSMLIGQSYESARATSLCVAATARAEGYPGDVNSTQAWTLFYASCR